MGNVNDKRERFREIERDEREGKLRDGREGS